MPVQFRRDEEPEREPALVRDEAQEWVMLREGIVLGLRSTIVCVVIAGVLLPLALRALERAILAADNLLRRGEGEHWQEMWMPAVLLAFFGFLFGLGVSWRLSCSATLGGALTCAIGAVASLVLAAIGTIAGLIIFEAPLPLMFWIAIGFLTVAAIGGVAGFFHWTS